MPDNITILITNNGMGNGDPALQQKLLGKYLQILADDSKLPAVICFYTDGVRLTCDGSPVLDQLRALSLKGVQLVVCHTCLDQYKLLDQVKVGVIGSMADIIEAQWKADKVITL
jgi:intracellular sulfur oxidation DsrE/DsrF family protein